MDKATKRAVMHYYRVFRGNLERTAEDAFQSARRHVYFLRCLADTIKAHKRRSRAAKPSGEARAQDAPRSGGVSAMTHATYQRRRIIFCACAPPWAVNDNTPSTYAALMADLRMIFGAAS